MAALIQLVVLLALLVPLQVRAQDDAFESRAEFSIVLNRAAGNGVNIDFRVKNNTKKPLLTFDPACLFRYSFPTVTDAGGRELKGTRPLANPCEHAIICIAPGGTYRGSFPASLEAMYLLQPGASYRVAVTFIHEPSAREIKTLGKIVHDGRLAPNGRFLVGSFPSNALTVRVAD